MELVTAGGCCILVIVVFQFLIGGRKNAVDTSKIARRQDLHLQRKLQHALTGGMIYAASWIFRVDVGIAVLAACALAFYVLHGMRKRSKRVDEFYLSCFHGLLRREEINHSVLPGAFYFLVGCVVVLVVFPTDIALLSILHLSVGDPSASLIGSLYGRRKIRPGGKSLEGCLSCWLASSIVSLPPLLSAHGSVSMVSVIFAGLCAAIAESLHLGWDDNLTLPILSSCLLYLGRHTASLV